MKGSKLTLLEVYIKDWCVAHILVSGDAANDHTSFRMKPRPIPDYELLFGTSLAKVVHYKNSNLYHNIGTQTSSLLDVFLS